MRNTPQPSSARRLTMLEENFTDGERATYWRNTGKGSKGSCEDPFSVEVQGVYRCFFLYGTNRLKDSGDGG